MNKILIINKPKGLTSRDVVNIIGKKFNTKKVGHAGTLDPLATGVLVICINKATSLVDLLSGYKTYKANATLGIETDTLDIEGKILKEENIDISDKDIRNCINNFIGKYNQMVPLYSATKINGKKLYEYARKNIEVELPSKEVDIKNIKLLSIKRNNNKIEIEFICEVSKGTYIRSLIKDIASKLGTVGIMTDLVRISQGKYKIEDSYTLEDIEKDNYKLVDITDIDINKEIVDIEKEQKIRYGQIIEKTFNGDLIMYLNSNKEAIAIYKTYDKDKTKVKPYKMF
ncbi:MAG TPA: tRNA pseudouridine(55) synthase TruB [Bacilli bacterium]|nr:tRNA pseudouridine(55) synthase TruB [Bacilli bacterium]